MQWSKCNFFLLIIVCSLNVQAQSKFTSKQCLDADFSTIIDNEGKFFGLLKNKLSVKKNKCDIEVSFKGILETVWKIDICREPIHMKVTSKGSQSVYKRDAECEKKDKTDFCYFRNELILNIQDQGLIFAPGQKENLEDSHGQVYCVYLLLKKHLDKGALFSLLDSNIDIFSDSESCSLPTSTEKNEVQVNAEALSSNEKEEPAPQKKVEELKTEPTKEAPRF